MDRCGPDFPCPWIADLEAVIAPASLRPLNLDDVTPEYVEWLNDPSVNKWLGTHGATLESQRMWVRRWSDREDARIFAICCRETTCGGRMIGSLKLEFLRDEGGDYAILALMIGEKNHWGRGYGEQAIRLGTSVAFAAWPTIGHVAAAIRPQNFSSLKAFENAGYTVEWPEKLWARVKRM